MNLKEWMFSNGYVKEGSDNKACCPFHNDMTFSAYLNPNSVYCFTCARVYKLSDFYRAFHVVLDYDPVESNMQKRMKNLSADEEVLFSYPFGKEIQ